MSSKKPVICIIHGAWHQPLHYAGLIKPLQRDGYSVLVPPLTSTGECYRQIMGKTVHDDAEVVQRAIEWGLRDDHEVVLVAHSYGALVATEVAAKQSVQERAARGLPGGVRAVIYISAILFPEVGMSTWDILFDDGQNIPPWITICRTWAEVNNPSVFYHDVPQPLADMCAFAILKQSVASMKEGVKHIPSDVKSRKVFVACKKAENNPLEAQLDMAHMAGAEIEVLDCGHSPFLLESQVPELLRIIKSV